MAVEKPPDAVDLALAEVGPFLPSRLLQTIRSWDSPKRRLLLEAALGAVRDQIRQAEASALSNTLLLAKEKVSVTSDRIEFLRSVDEELDLLQKAHDTLEDALKSFRSGPPKRKAPLLRLVQEGPSAP